MAGRFTAAAAGLTLCLVMGAITGIAQSPVSSPQSPVTSPEPRVPSPEAALVATYCAGCHNDRTKSGGMTLTALDVAHPESNAELAEKVIRKLRGGLMPPGTARR